MVTWHAARTFSWICSLTGFMNWTRPTLGSSVGISSCAFLGRPLSTTGLWATLLAKFLQSLRCALPLASYPPTHHQPPLLLSPLSSACLPYAPPPSLRLSAPPPLVLSARSPRHSSVVPLPNIPCHCPLALPSLHPKAPRHCPLPLDPPLSLSLAPSAASLVPSPATPPPVVKTSHMLGGQDEGLTWMAESGPPICCKQSAHSITTFTSAESCLEESFFTGCYLIKAPQLS